MTDGLPQMWNDGDHQIVAPRGTETVSTLKSLQSVTLDSVRSQASRELSPYVTNLRRGLVGEIVGGIEKAITEGSAALGASKLAQWGRDLLKFQRDAMTKTEEALDGQTKLKGRVDLLSHLEDTISVYAPVKDPNWLGSSSPITTSGFAMKGPGVVPFSRQLGESKGAELLPDGGFVRLLDKGKWKIITSFVFDSNFLLENNGILMYVETFDPKGKRYAFTAQYVASAPPTTLTKTSVVTVPEPGYRVRVRIVKAGASRALIGGPAYNSMTIDHISRHVENDTGAEESGQINV